MFPNNQPTAPISLNAEMLAQARAPGLIRRVISALYDLMLLLGVLVMAAALATIAAETLLGGDLTQGWPRLLFQVYLLAVCALYYLYFWSAGRQTLGMRAWRLQLVREDGSPLRWLDALRRLALLLLCMAPAGLGLWSAWFDPDKRAWHDRLSGTRLVILAKPRNQRKRASS
jgi:uncharacterized RDD family membrane protein YckC